MIGSRTRAPRSLPLGVAAAFALLVSFNSTSNAPTGSTAPAEFVWDLRTAEHLYNRAGFGAGPEELAQAVAAGHAATVDRLLQGVGDPGSGRRPEPPTVRADMPIPPRLEGVDDLLGVTTPASEDPQLVLDDSFYFDGGRLRLLTELRHYTSDWIQRMIAGDHPVRERMTLFWHGHFVSSFEEVPVADDIIGQIELLRTNALGDFRELVRLVARDPAMLKYLNNDINVKTSPNENWARELMELFTLGEGNYTEDDIKGAARAFSGWTVEENAFGFDYAQHDYGVKTVLGVTGNLDGVHVMDILFEQPACTRFIAGKLLAYFEGTEPEEERLDRYATLLREEEFHVGTFLRTLFLDEAFYRDAVVGNRVAAPLEYFAGMVRRLGIQPPPDMLFVVAGLTGQRLLAPPNVKGWEEGLSWLTTSTVMQRSNFGGILLGHYDRELEPHEIKSSMVDSLGREFNGPYRDYLAMIAWMQEAGWDADSIGGALWSGAHGADDTERLHALLDRLLAVPVEEATARHLEAVFSELQPEFDADLQSPEFIRRLVHVILSLPEAQVL